MKSVIANVKIRKAMRPMINSMPRLNLDLFGIFDCAGELLDLVPFAERIFILIKCYN